MLRNFENELADVVALSFFVPLLIGTGGNIGSQTVTLIVRAMALNEVAFRDVAWIAFKELRVGLILGAIMAVIAFGRAWLLGVGYDIGFVVATTILAICLWSATVAAVLPLVLRRLRVDPAVVSAPLIATLVGRHRADHLLRDRQVRPALVGRGSAGWRLGAVAGPATGSRCP